MPRDPRKHQKALMKKRSKQKAAAQHKSHQQALTSLSPQSIIRRRQPDGDICFATYLVDKYCLGVKDTFGNAGFSLARYQNEVRNKIFRELKPQECPIELAHQMIYQSIDYAAQFGFQPEKDFAYTQFLLAPRGELEEPYQLTFGKDGKPFFIAGPHDNVARILRQLEKTAGPGNYHYLAPLDVM